MPKEASSPGEEESEMMEKQSMSLAGVPGITCVACLIFFLFVCFCLFVVVVLTQENNRKFQRGGLENRIFCC